MTQPNRCPWCKDDPQYCEYHDTEWGVPQGDDRALFEKLCLEGFQAGLSWLTILRKRENFRAAFEDFDPEKVALFTPEKINALMANTGIVRNRLKILAALSNAQAFIDLSQRESFSTFLWKYVDGIPIANYPETMDDVPAQTKVSQQMSKDLKKLGFKFVGPTICYAFMQSVGMVNDHLSSCDSQNPCQQLAQDFKI